MGAAHSSVAVLHLYAPEFADSAFGVGVIDTHAFANLRLAIKQVLRVSNARAARLALDKVMLGLADNRATIASASRSARRVSLQESPRNLAVIDLASLNESRPGASALLRRSVAVCLAWTLTVPLPGS